MDQHIQQDWSKDLPKDGILIPPEESLLERALVVGPIVHYFPTPKAYLLGLQDESQVTAEAWAAFSDEKRQEADTSIYSVRKQIYTDIVAEVGKKIWGDYPEDYLFFRVRGGGISIGNDIEFSPPVPSLGYKVKGLAEIIATGSETHQEALDQHFTWMDSKSIPYDGGLGAFVGMWASLWSERVRNKVPNDKKHLIHPAVLVLDERSVEFRDIYILDNLDIYMLNVN